MTPQEFAQETQQLEEYFSKILKTRFKELANKNLDFDITFDYQTHKAVDKLLEEDGLVMCGMSVNLNEFALHLEFDSVYKESADFPFDRLTIGLGNDGDYFLRLNENLFSKEWSAQLEDNYRRYLRRTTEELRDSIKNIELIHMGLLLKRNYQP